MKMASAVSCVSGAPRKLVMGGGSGSAGMHACGPGSRSGARAAGAPERPRPAPGCAAAWALSVQAAAQAVANAQVANTRSMAAHMLRVTPAQLVAVAALHDGTAALRFARAGAGARTSLPRQLCFCRMQSEKSCSSADSCDTMHRYAHTCRGRPGVSGL